MNGKDFINSKWCQEASSEEKQKSIKQNFGRWTTRVNNTGLLGKAKQLYQFFLSSEIKGTQKILVAGALLYIISPLDLIPDFIPVAGWLDDIGVAGFALNYIFSQMDELARKKLETEGGYAVHSGNTVDELLNAEIEGTQKTIFKDAAADCGFSIDVSENTDLLEQKLDELAEISQKLKVENSADYIGHISNRMASVKLQKCIFAGRYSTGKSTLINSLLGNNILPTSPVPTTQAITYIMHGTEPLLCSETAAGDIIIHDSLSDLKNLYDNDIKRATKVTVTLPEFPFAGLSIVDTPGLEEPDNAISQLTLEAVPEADAVVVVLDAGYMESKVEFEFISSLVDRDKERKLFVVVNKADKLSSAEAVQIEKLCKVTLAEYGVNSVKVFVLSAQKGDDDPQLIKFKKELFCFLAEDLKSEAYRHSNNELNSYAESLVNACEVAIENASQSEQIKRQKQQENEQNIEKIRQEYERQEKVVINKFNQYRAQFALDFSNFISSLKAEVCSQIQQSSLETLQNKDNIANQVKAQITIFLDEKISAINNCIRADIGASQDKLRNYLAGMRLPITIDGKDYSNYANLFLPIAVAGGYLLGSVFTAIGILIVGLIGRNFFETAIAKYLRSLSVNSLRKKLSEDVSGNIDQLHNKLEKKLNEVFGEIEKNIIDAFKNDRIKAVSPLNVIAESTSNSIEEIDQYRKRLCEIIKK